MVCAVSTGVTIILFALYVQFSKTMGNVWILTDDAGVRIFPLMNLANLALEPVKVWTRTGRTFWTSPGLWPVNSVVWASAAALGTYIALAVWRSMGCFPQS